MQVSIESFSNRLVDLRGEVLCIFKMGTEISVAAESAAKNRIVGGKGRESLQGRREKELGYRAHRAL